ncbi:hypothetical protein AHAS_Ahas03G0150800 [Arachis hypogaea]
MKVMLLELYNEKITDRVPPEETVKSEDDKSKSPITLMEDWKMGQDSIERSNLEQMKRTK